MFCEVRSRLWFSPIGLDEEGNAYNINADVAAAKLAGGDRGPAVGVHE